MDIPRLTFFCELDSASLKELFADKRVTAALVDLQASVSLGILDFSPERVDVVQRLNKSNIPVTAWQLLAEEDGYWYNLDNAQQARARYSEFKKWSETNGLIWAGIGIDIEPDINNVRMALLDRWRLIPLIFQRLVNTRRYLHARHQYQQLIDSMQTDGFRIESYQLPLIIDERSSHSTMLQRLLGVVDVHVDREVLMLYSSFIRPWGPGILWSYCRDADFVALGVTGGGVDIEALQNKPPLSWEEFSRDLRLAWQWFDEIFIFSLEGCIQQDFLPRLIHLDWSELPSPPIRQTKRVNFVRAALQKLLWVSANPVIVLFATLAIVLTIRYLRLRRQERSG